MIITISILHFIFRITFPNCGNSIWIFIVDNILSHQEENTLTSVTVELIMLLIKTLSLLINTITVDEAYLLHCETLDVCKAVRLSSQCKQRTSTCFMNEYIYWIIVFDHNAVQASARIKGLGRSQKCVGLLVGGEHVFIIHEIRYWCYRFKSCFNM